MIWRSAIIAGYIALAIVIAIAYGGRGLTILFFFYFCAGAWVGFLLAWGWAARTAGRWNVERLESPPSRPERNGPRAGKGEADAAEHYEVDVERDLLPAPDAKRHQPVLVL